MCFSLIASRYQALPQPLHDIFDLIERKAAGFLAVAADSQLTGLGRREERSELLPHSRITSVLLFEGAR